MSQTGTIDDLGLRNGAPSTPQITGDWYTEGLQTNPADNAVIADTGQLQKGWYFVQMVSYSSADAIIELAHRDSTNASDNASQRQAVKAAIGNADTVFATKVYVDTNERFVARMDGAVTGNVQSSILISNIIG